MINVVVEIMLLIMDGLSPQMNVKESQQQERKRFILPSRHNENRDPSPGLGQFSDQMSGCFEKQQGKKVLSARPPRSIETDEIIDKGRTIDQHGNHKIKRLDELVYQA